MGNPGKSYPIRTAQPIMIWPVNKLLVNFVRTNFLPKMHKEELDGENLLTEEEGEPSLNVQRLCDPLEVKGQCEGNWISISYSSK